MDRLEVLEQTIAYYSEDVNRRCRTEDVCCYSPLTIGKENISEGCAIGRLLPLELRNKLDKEFPTSNTVSKVFDMLPKEIQDLSLGFLEDLQSLHDSDSNWDSKGLTKTGISQVNFIKKHFNL